jgi:tRNA-uridine 2-sulfurtransferase
MQNWEEDSRESGCRAEEDRKDAIAVCGRLGIRCHTRNFAAEYWDGVFAHFVAEYRAGRTPNPDVLCNREIKFRTFLDHARALGAERIATGHYARVRHEHGRWQLLRGLDVGKDQSYFLYTLGQEALSATLFPVGELPNRKCAGSPPRRPADPCEEGLDRHLLHRRARLPRVPGALPADAPGEIVDPDGVVLGEHGGAFFYTLGQREGLNLGGVRGRPQAPWFVVGKDVPATC